MNAYFLEHIIGKKNALKITMIIIENAFQYFSNYCHQVIHVFYKYFTTVFLSHKNICQLLLRLLLV